VTNLQITRAELGIIRVALWELLERDPYHVVARATVIKLSLVHLRGRHQPEKESPAPAARPLYGSNIFSRADTELEIHPTAPAPASALAAGMASAQAAPVLSAADRRLLADLKVAW